MNGVCNKSPARGNKQGGFVLGELLLAVAIVAVLVSIGYGIFNTLSKDTASQDLTQKTVAMVGKVKSVYGNSGDFSAISGTVIGQLGAKPDTFRISGGNLVDNLGNNVDVNGSTSAFALRYQGLTQDNCASIASGLAGLAYQVNIGSASAVSIAAGVITGGSAYKASGGTPDPSAMATGCGAAAPLAVALQFR